ncbi:hypothetical protein [Caballeronia insecticola]|uniref:Uncharacterized protein n=1 Tax=Caballeronia insecticola TaxID=758793 RepID=R4X1F3_9BURK|nr:hypothetical protein [Caballeronia insecticola]BAN28185.1 hypothetical protein BRPE64_ECDS00270 [Caballeronia insecticola]
MAIAITCASCGKVGLIDEEALNLHDGKIDVLAFTAPEGFHKVMFGLRSEDVYLYCSDCKVPADLPTLQ